LSLDVSIEDDTFFACRVLAELDGALSVSNLVTGERYTEAYDGFRVLERAESQSTFLVDIDGAISTDCLGTVDVLTRQSLRISSANACPVAGELELSALDRDVTSRISYTDQGGIRFDLDANGSIDDTRPSCADLDLNQCNAEPIAGLCGACNDDQDCFGELVCVPCFLCESATVTRCAPEVDPVICEDGAF
jgi:hypothetical protein